MPDLIERLHVWSYTGNPGCCLLVIIAAVTVVGLLLGSILTRWVM